MGRGRYHRRRVGADNLTGGAGTDTFNLVDGDFAAGESIDGGAGTDSIVLTGATIVDFSTGTIGGIESLVGSAGDDTVTLTAAQWAASGSIDLGAGTNVVNVVADGDISASGTPTVSNVTTGNLIGRPAAMTRSRSSGRPARRDPYR